MVSWVFGVDVYNVLVVEMSFPFSPLCVQQEIRLSTWDLAGQEVYYATHQCFLSRNTLYLAVWNMEKGEDGIENLRPWLLNIQVKIMAEQCVCVCVLVLVRAWKFQLYLVTKSIK